MESHSFSTWSMRWVENRIALPWSLSSSSVAPPARVHRIEAAERLVHHDEAGVVQQRGDELDLLLHAFGELFGFLVSESAISMRLAQAIGRLRASSAVSPCNWPKKTSWSMTFIFL
jgi:hypothetical protein